MKQKIKASPCILAAAMMGLASVTALAADRMWIATGMSGADAMAALQGHCPTLLQPPPYITCADGRFVITATVSAKDRVYYIQRIEPTAAEPAEYARQTARELGFDGPGEQCQRYNNAAYCWRDGAGTKLFTGMAFDNGLLSSQLLNEQIEAEDGPP